MTRYQIDKSAHSNNWFFIKEIEQEIIDDEFTETITGYFLINKQDLKQLSVDIIDILNKKD